MSTFSKLTKHFQQAGELQPGRVVTVFLMTFLLFVVFNAYRNPPGLLAQLDQSTAEATTNSQDLDKIFEKVTGKGNVLLRFQGLDHLPAAKQQEMAFRYVRAVYSSYPTRVYVADAATVVPQAFTGNPFPNFAPTSSWLDEHQIKTVLVAQVNPDGSTRYYIPLPPKP